MNYETFCCGTKANTTVTKILQQKQKQAKTEDCSIWDFFGSLMSDFTQKGECHKGH